MNSIEGMLPAGPLPASDDARLRQSSRDLEGFFVEQLFKAMRETVPEGTLLSGGAGEEMFTGMMDAHLAAQVPGQWSDSLGEALYRQFRAAIGTEAVDIASPSAAIELPPERG